MSDQNKNKSKDKRANKVIGIISIKGGVGKTTTVANLGAAIANSFDKKVLLVDANFSAPNLGIHLGLTEPPHTLHDVMTNNVEIKKAIYSHEFGFDILPSSLNKRQVNVHSLKNKLKPLIEEYDIILLDSSPNLNEEILATMIASDEIYVVTTPDFPTLSCTLNAVKVAKERNTNIKGIILNKVRGKSFELDIRDIEEATNIPVISSIREDINFLESLSESVPLTLYTPKKASSVDYYKTAAKILEQSYKDPRFFHRIKDKLLNDELRFEE